jgi:lysophospholipase L1-like esterase
MKLWREDLQEKIFVIRNLAVEYGLTLIDFDRHLNEISQNIDPRRITKDGIHPTNLGSQIMAQLWSRIIDDKYVFDNQK